MLINNGSRYSSRMHVCVFSYGSIQFFHPTSAIVDYKICIIIVIIIIQVSIEKNRCTSRARNPRNLKQYFLATSTLANVKLKYTHTHTNIPRTGFVRLLVGSSRGYHRRFYKLPFSNNC